MPKRHIDCDCPVCTAKRDRLHAARVTPPALDAATNHILQRHFNRGAVRAFLRSPDTVQRRILRG